MYSVITKINHRKTVGHVFSKRVQIEDCAGDKIEKNEMGWACGAYG